MFSSQPSRIRLSSFFYFSLLVILFPYTIVSEGKGFRVVTNWTRSNV